jgi:hypothetical protein
VPVAAVKAEREKRQKAEQENQRLREQIAFQQGQAAAVTPPPGTQHQPAEPAGPPAAPVLEDYESFPEYQAADRQYIIDVSTYNARQVMQQEAAAQRQQAHEQQTVGTFNQRLQEAAVFDPDLPAIASTFHLRGPNYIPLTPAMQEAILESDVGPKLLRYFADHKPEAANLAALTPAAAMRGVGRIEAQILATPKPAPPAVISQAPDPITPLNGKGSAGSETELKDMPMADYFKRRAPLIIKRR